MHQVPESFINWFRLSAPYIRKHREATFVIALPGEAIEHPNFINLVHDLAMLQSLGAKLVIVQGARIQITRALENSGVDAPIEQGIRVSSDEAMPYIIAASNGTRTELESAMSAGLIDSPMYQLNLKTLSGNFIYAKPLGVRDGVDYQYTGLVRQVDSKAIQAALGTGAAVICNTLGYSSTGEVFNLSLNECTLSVATSLKADKVIGFMSDETLSPMLKQSEVRPKLAHAYGSANMEEAGLADALAEAVDRGIERSHLVSYEQNGALLKELFTHDGAGLLISKIDSAVLREAQSGDVGSILELIQPMQEAGALVQRTRELLEEQIENFSVMEIDGTAVGCAALQPLDNSSGEIACVAVQPEFQGRGYAQKLLDLQIAKAKNLGIKNLFVLSTQATHWFIERGFREINADCLPDNRRAQYNVQRKPKVLVKELNN
ncbi:MAG: amino-acid N-acetyltransferase [Pseudomonadales bacterium]